MLMSRVGIESAESPHGICNIGPSCGHPVHNASNYQLVYSRMSAFFGGLPLVIIHCNWRHNWPGFVECEHRNDQPHIAILNNVNCVMLLIAYNVDPEIV